MPPPFRSLRREAAPAPHVPGTRALRAQSVQRLQIGLFGLAMMLLLVSLVAIIMQHARVADAGAAARAVSSGGSDPLADIGVVPSPEASHRTTGRTLPRP